MKKPTKAQQQTIQANKTALCKLKGHNWQPQFTGTLLIHKICTRCKAEKFE